MNTTPTIPKKRTMNPTVVMLIIVSIAVILTYILPSGEFQRNDKLVVPNSYQIIAKEYSITDILIGTGSKDNAMPVSIMQGLEAVPEGIVKKSKLIFMVMFIGGMFGILTHSGAINAGLERSLSITKGNVYVLVPVLMIVFSMGSTFMGMAKEYLLVIPMVVAMTDRLGLSRVTGLAIVALAVKVGYLSSLTNPYALTIAQPLVGVPVFSGMSMRIATYIVMMTICIGFVLWNIRRESRELGNINYSFDTKKLSIRHTLILSTLAFSIIAMVYAAKTWHWKSMELSTYYLFLSIIFAGIAGMKPSEAAEAFITGMKKVLIAAVLIGLATAVAIVLEKGQVIDTIINYLVGFIGTGNRYTSAYSMLASQLLLDVAIPSTSGQAAVTMPILGPVGQLVGVSPQTTVFAFLMGNGLSNVITPTSSGLLIFLATAEVSWTRWAKYVLPCFALLMVAAVVLLTIAVYIGY